MEAYISIAICHILPHAPKEVGVLNEVAKLQNKLCSPIIFGTDLLGSQPFTLIEEIDKLNPNHLEEPNRHLINFFLHPILLWRLTFGAVLENGFSSA
jgi:hypothetical protein